MDHEHLPQTSSCRLGDEAFRGRKRFLHGEPMEINRILHGELFRSRPGIIAASLMAGVLVNHGVATQLPLEPLAVRPGPFVVSLWSTAVATPSAPH